MECNSAVGRASARSVRHMETHGQNEHGALERIQRHGSATRNPTDKQTHLERRSVGSAIKANCFICHKFLKKDGTVEYRNTTWQCKNCKMPLCKLSRIDARIGRTETCLTVHQESDNETIGCNGRYCSSMIFPKELQVNLHPRRSNRVSGN